MTMTISSVMDVNAVVNNASNSQIANLENQLRRYEAELAKTDDEDEQKKLEQKIEQLKQKIQDYEMKAEKSSGSEDSSKENPADKINSNVQGDTMTISKEAMNLVERINREEALIEEELTE